MIESILPISAKVGDPCPYCAHSNHTGVWNRERQRYDVCKVCGDRGKLDQTALKMYQEKR